jgi:NAD(P)-dependent dehydrogenase (short-subunit alcohol dehydrogenase family)
MKGFCRGSFNSLIPGPTKSDLIISLVQKGAATRGVTTEEYMLEFATNSKHANLIKRFAELEEVANMAAFLCSELATAITGAPIRADGGSVRSAF